ncbi:MAG: RNA polymerase sigma factor [Acidimicrobiia bacterium]|nr:MAG: RNA polymerase sigma factor [Acidimicrobiia bacterium]
MTVRKPAARSVTTVMSSQRALDSLPVEAFESVMEAARAGAEWAWERIVSELDPPLRAYVRRLGSDDVDEAVGETWLHVARGLPAFRGDAAGFRSWVFMVAHHRVIDQRRRSSRRPAVGSDHRELGRLAPPSPSAETEAVAAIEETELMEALRRLPAAQREAILLRVMGGFSTKEIARIMGRTPGAVNQLQQRAFRRLRKILEGRRTK